MLLPIVFHAFPNCKRSNRRQNSREGLSPATCDDPVCTDEKKNWNLTLHSSGQGNPLVFAG